MTNNQKKQIREYIIEEVKKQSSSNNDIEVSIYSLDNKIIIRSNNQNFVDTNNYKSKYSELIKQLAKLLKKIEPNVYGFEFLKPKDNRQLIIKFNKKTDEELEQEKLQQKEKQDFLMAKEYLISDKVRADIEEYDIQILKDINRGHWEVKDNDKFVYRNPIKDIKEECVVGIDFGTKSTIVVCQNENEKILPMMIGGGRSKENIDSKSYENPTILEFINLDNFIQDYNLENARPKTKWKDLTISHIASEGLLNSSSEDYYSFFNELKQWCISSDESINIKDKNKNIYKMKNFLKLEEKDLNPIEIYAYYLGLYINNMRNGIYLNYLLSFPVTYEKQVRDKIIESFENGLKKSLPEEILQDNEIMDKFSVSSGASEPSAYAISALKEYGFDPEDNEKVYYAVFDFGGGTTDFDFGIFREANQKGERRYDYAIEHFGAGGDKYLGGENLLHLIAFEVFKENANIFRKEKLSFKLHPESSMFVGGEYIINDSQEARLNTRQLMEKLRPIWEKSESYEQMIEQETVNINLYKNDGTMATNVEININIDKIEKILKNRIDKGVENFFECLKMAFNKEEIENIEDIKIFLAGNSSKSQYVKTLFEKHIGESAYEIYPPLGTEDAYKKQEELGLEVYEETFEKPTGKTGVAFGLVEGRKGGSIKVVDRNTDNDEARFKYYVGIKKKQKLNPVITPESRYNEWVELMDAYEEYVEIHYTTSSFASTNKLDISETTRVKIELDETYEEDDIFVYIRPISPSEIEYAVAREDGFEILGEIKNIKIG